MVIFVLVLWTALYLAGRSQMVSDYLRREVLARVSAETGYVLNGRRLIVNVLPFFIEIRGLSVADGAGNLLLRARRVKLYPDPVALMRSRTSIDRMVLDDAYMTLTKESAGIAGLAGGGAAGVPFDVRTVSIRDSALTYRDESFLVRLEDIDMSAVIKGEMDISFDIGSVSLVSDAVEADGMMAKGRVSVLGDRIRVHSMLVRSGSSSLSVKGYIVPASGNVESTVVMNLDVAEFSRALGMKIVKDGVITASANIGYLDGLLSSSIRLSGEFYLESLMSFFDLDEPLRGLTTFNGRMDIEGADITARADARMVNGHIYGVDVDDVTCQVKYSDSRLYFYNGKARAFGGKADAEVYITLPDVDRFMVKVRAEDMSARKVLKLIGMDIGVSDGRVSGEIVSEGEVFSPRGWFSASFEPSDGDVLKRIEHAEGTFRSRGEVLYLSDVFVTTRMSQMNFSGTIDLVTDAMHIDGSMDTKKLADILEPYVPGASGNGFALFALRGTTERPEIRGGVTISAFSFRSLAYDRLESVFYYRADLLRLDRLAVTSGNESHSLRGTVRFPGARYVFDFPSPVLDMSVSIENLPADRLLEDLGYSLPLRGPVRAHAEISGTPDEIRINASVEIRPVSIYGIEMDIMKTRLTASGGEFRFSELEVTGKDSVLTGDLAIDRKGNYTFRTDTVSINMGKIPLGLNIDRGTMEIEVKGRGTIGRPYLTSTIRIHDLTTGGIPAGYGEMRAVLKDGRLTLVGSLFDGKVDIEASVRLSDGYRWEAELDFHRGVYDFIPAYFVKDLPHDLMLSLEGHIRLYGDRDEVNGHVRLSGMSISLFGQNFVNAQGLTVDIRKNRIFFREVSFRSGSASFSVAGEFVPFRHVDITLYGDSSLGILRGMSGVVDRISGYGSFVFTVNGGWDDPVINGGITVRDSVIGLRGFPHRFVGINGYVYIDGNEVVIESLAGKLGGGEIAISGMGVLKGLVLQRLSLDAVLSGSTIKLSGGIVANIKGGLIYRGTPAGASLAGHVYIERARITRRVDWKSRLVDFNGHARVRGESGYWEKTELNVKIQGGEDIVVDNNIAKTKLKVDLLLSGNIGSPRLFGRIETERGVVYFRNNEFRILHASADFMDPEDINPYFDVTAVTAVKGYNIRIAIEGQMPRLNLSLLSDPPLDETDILGLLTVGEVGSRLQGLEAGIGTAEATSFLTGKYQDVIEERLTMITGLDRFQVEPYVSEKTGQLAPRVTVSKRLLGDRLFVVYSSLVGGGEEDVIKLEYQIDRHVSLIGIREERGTLGADIKFRFEFR